MKKHLHYPFILLLLGSAPLASAPSSGYLFEESKRELAVHNRILAIVNGEPVSLIDVVNHIDTFFDRQFAQYANSIDARFQFYQINWKKILDELIEKKLILAEAKMLKVEISTGELNKEIDRIFGPNLLVNLDKAQLTYEEAKERVLEEMLVRRMLQMRVHSRAIRQVSPQTIQQAYEAYALENRRPNVWSYRVITIRGQNETACAEAASSLYHCLTDRGADMGTLSQEIECVASRWPDVVVRVSDENHHTDEALSSEFKQVLMNLQPGQASQPVTQQSRSSNAQVLRIFYLSQFVPGGQIPIEEIEKKIENQLLEEAIDRETIAYIQKLKREFPVEEQLPKESDPLFSLKEPLAKSN